MKNVILGLIFLGLTTQMYAQEPTLTEQLDAVYVVHNYKYLSSAGSEDVAIPVQNMQFEVSTFNVKNLDIYSDENELYDVYFFIPEGKVLASYDENGVLLRTAERYKDISLPISVSKAISKRFPNWSASKNVYLVNYHESGKTRKLYKIVLEKGKHRIRVKIDDTGHFL